MSEYAIRVEGLGREYVDETGWFRKKRKVIKAVDQLSFAIDRGEVFGLLGPNGAGKTTTIKIMSTLLIPTVGTVEVLGLDAVKQHEQLRPRIGVVFGGERSLYWRLSARDNLTFFADLYRVPRATQKKIIPALLEQAGLSEVADRRVETFSKGMKQRLTIIRGLVNSPEVLFLDEPTIGLDPVGAHELRQLVANLARQGTTVILTTHYMAEAEVLCDRIGVIKNGKLAALDSPAKLKYLSVGLAVVEVSLQHVSAKQLESIRSLLGVGHIQLMALGTRLILHIPTEAPQSLMQKLRELLGDVLIDVRMREATLEDAYLRLVGGNS